MCRRRQTFREDGLCSVWLKQNTFRRSVGGQMVIIFTRDVFSEDDLEDNV